MATNFLFGNQTPSGFTLEGAVELQADLTITESHQRRAEVTSHPVESGATISDHIILPPETVQLDGFVTDATITEAETASLGRTQEIFDSLEQLWNETDVVTVVTGYKTYENMVIVDLSLPRDRPSSMRFSMTLQKLTVVETEMAQIAGGTTTANAADQDTADRASNGTEAGRQPTTGASAGSSGSAQSTLSSLLF